MRCFKTYCILFLGIALLSSCGRSSLNPVEYVQYVQDEKNGLSIQENINGIKFGLQYQPTDYLVFSEAGSFDIPSETFKQEYDRFKGLEHYNFHIDRKKLDSLFTSQKANSTRSSQPTSQYSSSKTEYIDFGIKKDIKLIEDNDTLACSICECESDGGIHPYYSFIIGFPKKVFSGDRAFLFNGNLIHAGEVKLLVSGSSIKNIPSVKML
jgi:hypothetical protein